MDLKDMVGAIAQVNSAWSIAAFAIAAILVVLNRTLASPDAQKRRAYLSISPDLARQIPMPLYCSASFS